MKVGEVVKRIITREAENTISQLIPTLQWDTIVGVSVYPQTPKTENFKSKVSIRAKSTQSPTYLLEKEGDIIFPEVVVKWWNPQQKRLLKRTLPSRTVVVGAKF